KLNAPPYLAAREEGIKISMEKIFAAYCLLPGGSNTLIVEDSGGLNIPLNDVEFVSDLIRVLNARVILVSKNCPGSLNHSLLTSKVSRQKNLRVLGWVFNDKYLDYENDIARWSGFPKLGSVPRHDFLNKEIIAAAAAEIRETILQALPPQHAQS
ncbi:MAG: ATP-dependent dethiobiotin synthetase BioD, partial [Bacteroidota bacterium]